MDADMYKPIGQRWAEEDELLGVRFGQGWLFSRVIARGRRTFKHYSGVGNIDVSAARNAAEASLTVTISGQAVSILKLNTEKPFLYHGSIGIFPAHIQAIVRQPAAKTALGKFQNVGTEVNFSGSASTRYYSFDGEMSPYERPTEAAELIIPPNMEVGFEWYDPGQYDAEPTLKLMFMMYELQILRPNSRKRTWENLIIKLMAQKRIRAKFRTCGDVEHPADLPDNTKKDWGEEHLPLNLISLEEATKLPASQNVIGGI